jgi:S1-C subfamily serine protease
MLTSVQGGQRRMIIAFTVVLTLVVLAAVPVIAWQQARMARSERESDEARAEAERKDRQRKQELDDLRAATERKDEQRRRGEPDVIFADYNESVFLVRAPMSLTTVTHGTAFVVDAAGTLATNAHVAEPVSRSLRLGFRPIILSQRGRARHDIVEARWHRLYDPRNLNSPDVGILKVRFTPGSPPCRAIPLASESELRRLVPGAPLCYIGFPFFNDNDYDSQEKMVSRIYQGTYNRPLPGRSGATDFRDLYVLEHSMATWGGASGSPIFDRQGKVVAIHNAGISVRGTNQAGNPNKTGIRIDQLNDLLGSR